MGWGDTTVVARLLPSEKRAFRAMARLEGRTVGAMLRELIVSALKERGLYPEAAKQEALARALETLEQEMEAQDA